VWVLLAGLESILQVFWLPRHLYRCQHAHKTASHFIHSMTINDAAALGSSPPDPLDSHNEVDNSAESDVDEQRIEDNVLVERSKRQANRDALNNFIRNQEQKEREQSSESAATRQNEESNQIIDQARNYQQELFERAKEENVIAVLDTGSGKTLIAALLIRHVLEQEVTDRAAGRPPRIIFFLVNSVHLARQQTRFLADNLPTEPVVLFGDSKDDLWKRAEWDKIFQRHNVVVCTAAVLDQCLMLSYLRMEQICLLVFDEAHHCKKDHPYSKIIRDYYLKCNGPRPRIFGMTASPVDSKHDVKEVAADLEALLHSKIVTTADLSVFEFAPKATNRIWTYSQLPSEFETALYRNLHRLCHFVDKLGRYFAFAKNASAQIGTWGADRVWAYAFGTTDQESGRLIKAFERSEAYSSLGTAEEREAALHSLQEAALLVQRHHVESAVPGAQHLSSKVSLLYEKLQQQYAARPDTRTIVFVEQKLTAGVLNDMFLSLRIPHVRSGILVGGGPGGLESTSWRNQEQIMTRFRAGEINLIFATSVAEEGIDIPQCNLVVRFDLYTTPIQYMQSRGRARMKDSIYAHMVEEGNFEQRARVDYAIDTEEYIKLFCRSLPPDRLLGKGTKLAQLMATDASCRSFATYSGAIASYSNSLLILRRYAHSLQRVGALTPEIYEEDVDALHGMFRYTVRLPITAQSQVKGARGEPRPNRALAKRAAAFNCVFKLRRAGLLDDNLDSVFKQEKPRNANARLAVSTKRHDYAKKVKPDFWSDSGVGSTPTKLFLSILLFKPERPLARPLAPLVLLTRQPLPPIPVFTVFVEDNIEARVSLNRLPEAVPVSAHDVDMLTAYTLNGVFADVFNKVYARDSTKMSYWLAPHVQSCPTRICVLSDVVEMDALSEAAEERRRWEPGTPSEAWCHKFLVDPGDGRFHYFSERVASGVTIWDPPPPNVASVKKRHKGTIIEFSDSTWRKKSQSLQSFASRYDSNQPVLVAEMASTRRNFLDKGTEEQTSPTICYVAPQPLEIARVDATMAATCQLWPALLHRVESYLIVLEAFQRLGLSEVPADLALEAFTKDTNADDQENQIHSGDLRGMGKNYERLEFIGDSLLKLMTTITVFNRTTCDEEGMHCKRMELVCNRHLFDVATASHHQLFQYIRTSAFNRDSWYPEFLDQTKGRLVKLGNKTHALGMKTIADVCEAIVGACVMATKDHSHKLDLGIKAITQLVESDDHAITAWREVPQMYTAPEWSLRMDDPVAIDLARKVEAITGYRFHRPRLLRSAFTHSSESYSTVPDLQRLEFLGDACLDWACIWWLFDKHPERNPQWLTEHKMAMVSNKFLAALAVVLGFDKLLFTSAAQLFSDISSYAVRVREAYCRPDCPRDFWTNFDHPPKACSDLIESYLGAVLVDSGFDYREMEKFFEAHVLWYFERIEEYDNFANRHPTTFVSKKLTDEYKCRDFQIMNSDLKEGEIEICITAGILVHRKVIASGKGTSAKYARIKASRAALELLDGVGIAEFRQRFGCDCHSRWDGA